jgi:molybdenum cofactor biosynthesis protein MoaC
MVDITAKSNILRIATAEALVKVSSSKTIEAIREQRVPKGDVFEMSRAAGLLGVKKTPELLPDCHPIPIEYTGFQFEIMDQTIKINCTIKTIYKTGVEVEAMHGASIAALNMYDMLKPVDKGVSIGSIRLLSKKGGKSDYAAQVSNRSAAIIVASDSISAGKATDQTGKMIEQFLCELGMNVSEFCVIPDEPNDIRLQIENYLKSKVDLIIVTGGTGVSPRDQTPEALSVLIEKRLPGVEEAMRAYGQNRTPVAMFSRSIAGISQNSIILGIPGSKGGAIDSLKAVFPSLTHLFDVLSGTRHGK